MATRLKPIGEQVIVITGASSGIGLCTARMAAAAGARVVMAARNEAALLEAVQQIRSEGGEAVHVVADVGREYEVEEIAETAIRAFGGFDTWVNNAGAAIYGRIEDVPVEDQRRLFETNYWGVVYGSLAAIDHLRRRGGTIVNIGSTLSDRAIPLQGPYSATKHAVKAFTDALRMELMAEGAPVSVTLIKPAAIDTMYEEHARSYLDHAPRNVPPVYAPEVVARAVLRAAQHPMRDVVAGAGARGFSLIGKLAPGLGDRLMARTLLSGQESDRPNTRADNLYRPATDGRERAGLHAHTSEWSAYTWARLHPIKASLLVAGLGAAAYGVARLARSGAGGEAHLNTWAWSS